MSRKNQQQFKIIGMKFKKARKSSKNIFVFYVTESLLNFIVFAHTTNEYMKA